MYLKSLVIKNYRKYGESQNEICFAHSHANQSETEQYISESSSLMIGPNNSGKSTIVELLDTLQNTKAQSRNVFKHSDFNLSYLKKWYDNYVSDKSSDEIRGIKPEDLPLMEFRLNIGIDSEDDYISNFQDVLVISSLENNENSDSIADIDIIVKYEITNVKLFLQKLSEINQKNKNINTSNIGLDEELGDKVSLNELKEYYGKKEKNKEKIKLIIEYYDQRMYRDFLSLLDNGYYTLNFYPLNSNIPSKSFSLNSFLKVKTIQANTVKDNNTLSKAYNKIVDTYARKNDLSDIDEFIDSANILLKDEIDSNIQDILQDAINSIESNKNLRMNLHPNISLDKILGNSVLYEYRENQNYIPENQYGMGYTNLMVIIAEIADYFENYEKDDVNGAINILCIEEPETFMHPQMQELFIKNISKAISYLMESSEDNINYEKNTFQIIITTHSSHILNSKIQSGNTLNNIVYLDSGTISNINDDSVKIKLEQKNIDLKVFEYIKKYLRLELSDIFYADAIVIVEGQTEENYLRFLIDEDEKLRSHHIKVYRIDGAYGYQFLPLLEILNKKTVIITDLDINRSDEEKKNPESITDLNEWMANHQGKCLSTNETIKNAISADKKDNSLFNNEIIKHMKEDKLEIECSEKIKIYSQGKINKNYATSLEEAIILTNIKDHSDRIINLLKDIHPKIFKDFDKNKLRTQSYFFQNKLKDSKAKFTNHIVFNSITNKDYEITTPKYIRDALNSLEEYFEGKTNED